MNIGGINAPYAIDILRKNAKITLALPGSALALPGDIASDQARFCARSQLHLLPGSLLRLSGGFKSLGGLQVGETPVLCAFFERTASAIVLYVM